ncbi:MAG: hypothetical protein IKW21_05755 [Lachnospiraceae bacterium]|nr:hypothetical protein [Lachnospiraceae bacterium]
MEELILFIKENWGAVVGILSASGICIEVIPVKVYPVSWLLKKIGSIMNADLIEEIQKIKKEYNDHLEDYDKEKINEIRKEINDFSLSCQRGEHHTRDEFERIFSRIGEYHDILRKRNQENGKIDIEVAYINKIYQMCLEEHRFFEG